MSDTPPAAKDDAAEQKLARLTAFLARDPQNLNLLADAAAAACAAGDFAAAADLIARHAAIAPLTPALENLRGTIALATGNHAEAQQIFEQLFAAAHDSPALRFNLAWALAMAKDYERALALIDDATLAAPGAPALSIRLLHHQGRCDEALGCGDALQLRFPGDRDLCGALAAVALDAEQPELARRYAEEGRGSADAEAALGVLALGAHDASAALALFESALALQPQNARAWVGRGLAQQALGQTPAAAATIDKGAELFADHPGSWIAAGWAHYLAGDGAAARARFEKAEVLDPAFSESHGGLAVLDLAAGDLPSARRRCEIALRLDKKSFGGALAKSLLLESEGQAAAAHKVRAIALATPVGAGGMTIAAALAGLAARKR
jgi:tetratricopeptide (TPR) repeat protein